MEKKCVSVKLSPAEMRKIQGAMREGESMSATLRRLILGRGNDEKADVQEWTNLVSRIEASADRGEASEKKIDLLAAKLSSIFSALEKRMESIAESEKDGDQTRTKWVVEVEETLAMLRIISQWMVSGSPSAMAKVRQNPDVEKFLL